MTKLLLWKQKVKEFYGEHDFWITPLFKFLLAFVVFSQINGLLGFMRQIDNIFVVLILSLICAMFSINVMTILACLLILGHCYAVGIETAGFAAVLLILLMILFLRFTSEDNVALILTPISFTLHIPAAVPVAASESTADKEETVYVKTDANGEEKTVIVSDWLKNFSGEAKIKDATDLTDEIYKNAKRLFVESWKGEPLRLIGVALTNLKDESFEQLSLFEDNEKKERRRKLDATMDEIRRKYGNDKIKRASIMNSNGGIARKARAQIKNEDEKE